MDILKMKQPRRPITLPNYTEFCLQALAERGLTKPNKQGVGLGSF